MSRLDREVNEVLQRAQANDLGRPRARFAREPEPLPDSPGWGVLSFLQPATPWHLIGIGVLLAVVGRFLGRMPWPRRCSTSGSSCWQSDCLADFAAERAAEALAWPAHHAGRFMASAAVPADYRR